MIPKKNVVVVPPQEKKIGVTSLTGTHTILGCLRGAHPKPRKIQQTRYDGRDVVVPNW